MKDEIRGTPKDTAEVLQHKGSGRITVTGGSRADGFALPPYIIWACKMWDMRWGWDKDEAGERRVWRGPVGSVFVEGKRVPSGL